MSERILCLTEHAPPRVSGTARYTHEICAGLARRGHAVRLVTPGCEHSMPTGTDAPPYDVVRLNTPFPVAGDPSREQRYAFCQEANAYAQKAVEAGEAQTVHILYGMFLLETVEAAALQRAGADTYATVHNIPPMECGRTWPGMPLLTRAIDAARLRAVGVKNAMRLQRHRHNGYITPSQPVKDNLSRVLPRADIAVIGHGVSRELIDRMASPKSRRPAIGEPLRILTVAGWVPHKRQHLIPSIGDRLRAAGIRFQWDIAGPSSRAPTYFQYVMNERDRLGLTNILHMHEAVDDDTLVGLYDSAHLYVQPSTEEGFCITALDAAAAGLPIIGSPAGALPDLCSLTGGRLVDSNADAIARAITHFIQGDHWSTDASTCAAMTRSRFSWRQAVHELERLYDDVRSTAPAHQAPIEA